MSPRPCVWMAEPPSDVTTRRSVSPTARSTWSGAGSTVVPVTVTSRSRTWAADGVGSDDGTSDIGAVGATNDRDGVGPTGAGSGVPTRVGWVAPFRPPRSR